MLSFGRILARGLRARRARLAITIFILSLGVGLTGTLLHSRQQIQEQLEPGFPGAQLVFGRRGSALELVLNTLFHFRPEAGIQSTGLVPENILERLRAEPGIRRAIPIFTGDQIGGYRLIGTNREFFDSLAGPTSPPGSTENTSPDIWQSGTIFKDSLEVVAGHRAAEALSLEVGGQVEVWHDLAAHPEETEEATTHEGSFQLAGILRARGNALDRAFYINIDDLFELHTPASTTGDFAGLDAETQAALAALNMNTSAAKGPEKGVDGVILELTQPGQVLAIQERLNKKYGEFMSVQPVLVLSKLRRYLEFLNRVLFLLTGLVVFISLISALLTIYQSVRERQGEMRLLRSLGATRKFLFGQIWAEGMALTIGALLLGMMLQLGLSAILGTYFSRVYGLGWPAHWFPAGFGWFALVFLLAGQISGLLPAWRVYRDRVGGS